MESRVSRKPIGNFFIKKALQIRLTLNIILAALFATLITSGSLILVYYVKYQTVIVYQLEKLTQELNREHLIYLILPTLLVGSVVNLLLSFGVGLYASRKYAVPIYKLEQWSNLLLQGKFSAILRFREKEEMKELSNNCNDLSTSLRTKLLDISKQVTILNKNYPDSSEVKEIEKVLSYFELEASPIEVTTTFYATQKDPMR